MLAKPIKSFKECENLNLNDFIYEEKYDGYRILCVVNKKNKMFYTRQLKQDLTLSFDVKTKNVENCILDGEVIYLDSNNKLIPLCETGTRVFLKKIYKIFDIQQLNGISVQTKTVLERKKLLKKHIIPTDDVNFVEFFECLNLSFIKFQFENLLEDSNREGFILKNKFEFYQPDCRKWFKLKALHLKEITQNIKLEVHCAYTDKNNIYSRLQCGFTSLGVFKPLCMVSTYNTQYLNKIKFLLQYNKTFKTTGLFPPNTFGFIKFDRKTEKSLRHPIFCGFKE